MGYSGTLVFDNSKPDGTPRKLMAVSRLRELGWTARTGLRQGVEQKLASFLAQQARQVTHTP